jgi:O-antigen/teichoic acid export membrane protein
MPSARGVEASDNNAPTNRLSLARKGAWAVGDQGAFALSHFVLNILLARWLSIEDYGLFTVSYAVFLFVGTVHSGLLSEPLVVFAAGKYSGESGRYLRVLLWGHIVFSAVVAGALFAAGLILAAVGYVTLFPIVAALAFATPLILLQWLARHACYARLNPRMAAAAGVVYMLLIVAGVFGLQMATMLSVSSALALLGVASLPVSMWMLWRLEVGTATLTSRGFVSDVIGEHWRYGRWAVPTRVLGYVPSNIYYFILPAWGGLAAAGALRALMNLIMPMLQAYAALSNVMIPLFSRARAPRDFDRLFRVALMGLVSAAALYWVILTLADGWLLDLLYGGGYGEYRDVLRILGLLPITAAALAVVGSALRALARPDRVFWATVIGAVWSITAGAALAAWAGLAGATAALVIGSFASLAAMAVLYFRLSGAPAGDSHAPPVSGLPED